MNSYFRLSLTCAAVVALATGAAAQTGFPFQDETLRYSVNWPSGLSLGDISMSARRDGARWNFEMTVAAGVPGYQVSDHFHSVATNDLCSVEFDRAGTQGGRTLDDQTTFDSEKRVATLTRRNGDGSTEISIAACARDALDFLYFTRREMGQGRVPPPEDIVFGKALPIRLEYTGAETIQDGEKPAVTDRLAVYLKGAAARPSFEIFFARDAARTPLRIRVPLSIGTVSMELTR